MLILIRPEWDGDDTLHVIAEWNGDRGFIPTELVTAEMIQPANTNTEIP
jgi:hypothetical protein